MPSTTPVIDWRQLHALRELQEEGEPDVIARVIEMFREDAPARLARARAAADRGDCQALRLEAHSLRGTAGLLGASTLRDVSTEVERHAEAQNLDAVVPLLAAMARGVDEALEALNDPPPP